MTHTVSNKPESQPELLYFVLDPCCGFTFLNTCNVNLLSEICVSSVHRYAIKLLEDVVFFVVDQSNNGQPALEVTMNKANRERQKLMREQNILKQVCFSTI